MRTKHGRRQWLKQFFAMPVCKHVRKPAPFLHIPVPLTLAPAWPMRAGIFHLSRMHLIPNIRETAALGLAHGIMYDVQPGAAGRNKMRLEELDRDYPQELRYLEDNGILGIIQLWAGEHATTFNAVSLVFIIIIVILLLLLL